MTSASGQSQLSTRLSSCVFAKHERHEKFAIPNTKQSANVKRKCYINSKRATEISADYCDIHRK